jgi:hypothetical protein
LAIAVAVFVRWLVARKSHPGTFELPNPAGRQQPFCSRALFAIILDEDVAAEADRVVPSQRREGRVEHLVAEAAIGQQVNTHVVRNRFVQPLDQRVLVPGAPLLELRFFTVRQILDPRVAVVVEIDDGISERPAMLRASLEADVASVDDLDEPGDHQPEDHSGDNKHATRFHRRILCRRDRTIHRRQRVDLHILARRDAGEMSRRVAHRGAAIRRRSGSSRGSS